MKITVGLIKNILELRIGNDVGTGFIIEHESVQFLISAKHIFVGWDEKSKIQIFHDGVWKIVSAEKIGYGNGEVDIIVLKLAITFPNFDTSIKYGINKIMYGQEVVFLGYPYGLSISDDGNVIGKFPIPFIKQAIVSAVIKCKEGGSMIFLDGHNNSGFSGGPVVFMNSEGNLQIAGVIHGFISPFAPVYLNDKETEYKYKDNSGIILAYSIESAIDIITHFYKS